MKKICILILVLVCLSPFSFAEPIVLKSGKKIEGKIFEKTDKSIKLYFYGVPVTYYYDEIDSIDGKKINLPSSEEKKTVQETMVNENKLEGEYYFNKEYGIKFWCPQDWYIFDKNNAPKEFKANMPDGSILICLIMHKNNQGKWVDIGNVTVVAAPSFWNGLIKRGVEITKKDLLIDAAERLKESFKNIPPSADMEIIEQPRIVTINNTRFIRYIEIAGELKEKHANYLFLKDLVLFVRFMYAVKIEDFDIHKETFEKMVGSVIPKQ